MPNLVIAGIEVKVDQELILTDLSLTVKPGELHVIMGPNGAGKSSLAQVIMGHPSYELTAGEISFGDQKINQLEPEKRVKLGIALAYQTPPAVPGVKLGTLLNLISDPQKTAIQTKVKQLWPQVERFRVKELNKELSGGEKKISEILQLLALKPKLTIFDELDAGLDLDNWQKMVELIKTEFISEEQAVIFVSHQPQLVKELKPDYIHIILDKQLICSSQDYQQVLTTIQEHDYDQCRHCPSRAD
jgi:Fe-S cluster assembly ATP-binding protein